jgi:hypothetical protein
MDYFRPRRNLCSNCGDPYRQIREDHRFCKDACRKEFHRNGGISAKRMQYMIEVEVAKQMRKLKRDLAAILRSDGRPVPTEICQGALPLHWTGPFALPASRSSIASTCAFSRSRSVIVYRNVMSRLPCPAAFIASIGCAPASCLHVTLRQRNRWIDPNTGLIDSCSFQSRPENVLL